MKRIMFIWVLACSLVLSSLSGFAADKELEDGVVMVVYDGDGYSGAFTGFVIGEDREGYYIMTSYAPMEIADEEGIDLEDAKFKIFTDEDEFTKADVYLGPDEFTEDDILDKYLVVILKTRDKDIDVVSLDLNVESYDEDDVYTIGIHGGTTWIGEDDNYDKDKVKLEVTGDEFSYLDNVDHQELTEYMDTRFMGAPVFDEDDLVVGFIGAGDTDGYVEIEQIIELLDDEEVPYNQLGLNMLYVYAAVGVLLVAGIIIVIIGISKKNKQKTTPTVQQVSVIKANLMGISGEYAGSTLPISGDPLILGRDPNVCHLLYPKELDIISRKHCEIYYDRNAGKHMLVDYSTRGTFLNGNKMNKNQPYPLAKGSTFYVADPSQSFRYE